MRSEEEGITVHVITVDGSSRGITVMRRLLVFGASSLFKGSQRISIARSGTANHPSFPADMRREGLHFSILVGRLLFVPKSGHLLGSVHGSDISPVRNASASEQSAQTHPRSAVDSEHRKPHSGHCELGKVRVLPLQLDGIASIRHGVQIVGRNVLAAAVVSLLPFHL